MAYNLQERVFIVRTYWVTGSFLETTTIQGKLWCTTSTIEAYNTCFGTETGKDRISS